MFRGIQKQWVVGLILIGLGIGVLSFFVNAKEMEPRKLPQPGDYFNLEITSGTIGALAWGFLGGMLGTILYQTAHPYCGSGLISLGSLCSLGYALIGVLVGNVMGATLGVITVGSRYKVRGNLFLTILGGLGGATTAVFSILYLAGPILYVSGPTIPALLLITPVLTGLGAALGYNMGAIVELHELHVTDHDLEIFGFKVSW